MQGLECWGHLAILPALYHPTKQQANRQCPKLANPKLTTSACLLEVWGYPPELKSKTVSRGWLQGREWGGEGWGKEMSLTTRTLF